MKIIIDSREQLSYEFTRFDVKAQVASLPAGDYSIPGFEDKAAVERKTLQDLIACLTKGRKRFERELTRARHYELFAVVVESSMDAVRLGHYRSSMNPHSALQSIIAFQVRYAVPFLWCGSREGGEYVTYSLLQKYIREITERYKRATT